MSIARTLLVVLLIAPSFAHAVADWVWHNQNRVPARPDRGETVEVWAKVGYQFFTTDGAIYYTTDGSDPTGAFGQATNGTAVPFTFSHLEWDESAQLDADWWSVTLPAFERGTEVRYRIGFWHSGGGAEVFADNNVETSDSASLFWYTVGEKPRKAFSGQETLVPVTVQLPGVTDTPGEAVDLRVQLWTDVESAAAGQYAEVPGRFIEDTPQGDVYHFPLTPAQAGRRGYLVRVSTDGGSTWDAWGDPADPDSFTKVLVSPGWIRDAVVYQLFPRVHGATDANGNGELENTEFGDFKGVEADLNRIVALGVNTIWLMPIHPLTSNPQYNKSTDGSAGSPYAPLDYRAINPDYGTDQDLRDLIAAAKAKGLRVMLGFVPNHVAPDNVILDPNNPPSNGGYHPDWFVTDAQGNPIPDDPNWSDTVAWDFENPDRDALIQYIADALEYWVREYDIDGYRCDFAHWQPLDFWERAIDQVRSVKPEVFFLAEAYQLQAELLEAGFDAAYDFLPYNYLKEQVKPGNADAAGFAAELESYKDWQITDYMPFRYGENHDEERVTELYGSFEASRPHVGWSLLSRAVPMLYAGQEVGDTRRIPLFRSWNSIEDYPAPDWTLRPDALAWYRDVLALRSQEEALRRGTETIIPHPDVYLSVRQSRDDEVLLVVLNMELASPRQIPQLALNLDDLPFGAAVNELSFENLLGSGSHTLTPSGGSVQLPVNLPVHGVQVWRVRPVTTPQVAPSILAGYLQTDVSSANGGAITLWGVTNENWPLGVGYEGDYVGPELPLNADGSFQWDGPVLGPGAPSGEILLEVGGLFFQYETLWPYLNVAP